MSSMWKRPSQYRHLGTAIAAVCPWFTLENIAHQQEYELQVGSGSPP